MRRLTSKSIAVLQMLSMRALWAHYLRGTATTATCPWTLPLLGHFWSFQASHILKMMWTTQWLLASLLLVMKLLLLAVGLALLLLSRAAVPELLEHWLLLAAGLEWLLSRASAPEHWLHSAAGPEWLLSRALAPELLLYWLHPAAGPEWLLSRALAPELLLYWLHPAAEALLLLSRALALELLLYWPPLATGVEWLLSRAAAPELLLYWLLLAAGLHRIGLAPPLLHSSVRSQLGQLQPWYLL
jgi:hypothetical protein